MFLTVQDPTAGTTVDPAAVAAITGAPALLWGLIGPDAVLPPDQARALDGAGLVALTLDVLRGWPEKLRAVTGDTDPGTASWFHHHTIDPAAELTPWSAGPVTALGDAVHAMPRPRSATPATELIAPRDGVSTIPLATLRFQPTMAGYAPGRGPRRPRAAAPDAARPTRSSAGRPVSARPGHPAPPASSGVNPTTDERHHGRSEPP